LLRGLTGEPDALFLGEIGGGEEIRAAATGAEEALAAAPAIDLGVVAGAEDAWGGPTSEVGGAGVLGILEQPVVERLFGEGIVRTEDTRELAGDGIDQDERGKFAAGDDDVADGDLAIGEVLADAFVDALVAAADEQQAIVGGEFADERAIEVAALRGEQDDFRGRLGEGLDVLDGGEERLRLHDHAGAAAERGVIDGVVFVHGPIAELVDGDLDQAGVLSALEDGLVEGAFEHLGEEGEHVEAHSWSSG